MAPGGNVVIVANGGAANLAHEREPQRSGSWLDKKLSTLEALYHRFGREGLKDQPIADVGLLLSSKELQLRDAARGHDIGEDHKAANRKLELEVKDLAAYMRGQLSGLSLADLRESRQPGRERQFQPHKKREFELER